MKKKIALMLALALCVSLLSGCSGGTGEVETKPVESSPTESKSVAAAPAATDPSDTDPGGTNPGDDNPEPAPAEKEYQVPSVLGRTIEELENNKVILGDFALQVDSTVFSDGYEAGVICEQSPEAGSMVREGELVITVKISVGPETSKVTVPNLINARIEDVERQITSAGLTLKSVQYYPNDEYAEGRVFWQSLEAFKEVDRGSPIDLWVSSGSAETALPSQGVESSQPAVKELTSFTLSSYDLTLSAKGTTNDHYQVKITFNPADWTGEVTWSSSDERYATVDQYGVVTNVNSTTTLHKAVISVTAGGITQAISVYCRGVSAGDPPASQTGVNVGKQGTIVNAAGGLNVRSGPGTTYEKIGSLPNGATVTVLEDAGNGWYKISYAGDGGAVAEGYIIGDYISID